MSLFDIFRRKRVSQKPTAPDPKQFMIAAQWQARARFITHFCDFAGDPTNEWAPDPQWALPNRPDFIVLEFAPRQGREYWTYLSAGLSFVPQVPAGSMPHVEVVAYSDVEDARIAEFIFKLTYDIATTTEEDAAFQANDLWPWEAHGLSNFALLSADEPLELLDFPNIEKREEDSRYLLATTGKLDGEMKLDLLQLVPLTVAQWEKATEMGPMAVREEMHSSSNPKTVGWDAMDRPA